MEKALVENIMPLFFSERTRRDTQGRVIDVRRGVSLRDLTKIFRNTRAFMAFLLTAMRRLKKVGFTLKVYQIDEWFVTAVPLHKLPSPLTDEEAFVLALIVTLAESADLTVRTVEEEIEDLRIKHLQTRKIIENLLSRGLLQRTSSNPMRVQVSGLFYVEFSQEDEIKMKSLFQYHFLLGRQQNE